MRVSSGHPNPRRLGQVSERRVARRRFDALLAAGLFLANDERANADVWEVRDGILGE